MRYARLALWRNRESPSNNDFKQTIYSLFGSVHLKQERLDSAVYYYQQALADSRRRHDRQDEAGSLSSLARAFLGAGTPQQALPYARQAYAISQADQGSLACGTGQPGWALLPCAAASWRRPGPTLPAARGLRQAGPGARAAAPARLQLAGAAGSSRKPGRLCRRLPPAAPGAGYEAAHQRQQNQRLTETLRISYETEQSRQQVLLLTQQAEADRASLLTLQAQMARLLGTDGQARK